MGQHQMDQHLHYKSPRRRRGREAENLFEEIMAENFPNLEKETHIQIQKAQRVSNKMNPKKPTPRHITKCQKLRKKRERDQDGRAHGPPPPPRHEHIKNTSTCGVILTENKLETGRETYNQGCKKDPQGNRKGREAIMPGPALLEGEA